MARERVGRPSGEPYSADPGERYRHLVEDGQLGAPGSELAGRHAAMGGKRPRRRPVDVTDAAREVLLGHRELAAFLSEHEQRVERSRRDADRLRRLANGPSTTRACR